MVKVKLKQFIITILILLAFSGKSQNSSKDLPLIIVDEKVIDNNKMDSIDANDISAIEIIKDSILKVPYGPQGQNGVILIYTLNYSTKRYQEILSQKSEFYKNKLTEVSSDTCFLYFLENEPLQANPGGTLMYLKKDSIRSIEYFEKNQCLERFGQTKSKGCVIIKKIINNR